MRTALLITLLALATAQGEDIYIAATALGTGSGTSAANAKAYTFFNSAANWDALVNTTNGIIGPGDTVHVVGIINFTGTVADGVTNQLVFQRGGTPGNRITLKFDAGGRIRHPIGFGTGIIAANGLSIHDVTVEGANSSPVTTGAFTQIDVEIWNNGTNLGNQVEGTYCLVFQGVGDNVTIKNMYMYGAYVREYGNTTDMNGDGNVASLRGGSNLEYNNCRADYGEGGLGLTGQRVPPLINSNLRIINCYVWGASTALKIGVASGGINDGVVVTGNVLDGFGVWAGLPSPNQHHCDGIQTITGPGSEQRNVTVAYNRIGPDLGLYGSMNAHIFLEDNVHGNLVYNNLLLASPTPINTVPPNAGRAPGTANSFITVPGGSNLSSWNSPTGIRNYIYNNTCIGAGSGAGVGIGFGDAKGNIVIDLPTPVSVWDNQPDSPTKGRYVNLDYNIYYNANGSYTCGVTGALYAGIYGSGIIGLWQQRGWDVHSTQGTNPQVTFPTGVLASTSPARGFSPTQTLFSDDFYRVLRTVPWDNGAVKFTGTGPQPPAISGIAINAAGNRITLTLNEACVFGAGGQGGLTLSSSGGALTATYLSGTGSSSLVYTLSRLVGQSETSITATYTQPNNGIESSTTQLDLTSFASFPVTNSSTVAQAATPTFSPAPGAYSSTQNVIIGSSTPGATIRYTTDGTDPTTTNGTVYTTQIPTSLSTTYKARAFANGFLESPVATGAYQIGDFVIGNAWSNIPVTNQTGTFTWSFRATSSTSPNDCVLGLTNKTAATYSDLGVIARFAASGRIDAWNDGPVIKDYAAVNVFPYVAGQAYDFVVTVNIPSHTYSMTVVQAGGSTPTIIATNYGFRGAQATATNLNNFGAIATAGSVTVSNMLFSTAAPTLSLTGIATNPAGNQITATFNAQPSFGTGGQGGLTVSATGGATTASSPSIGANSITWTLSRAIGSGESVSATYVQPGNGIEAASGGADLASFAGQSVQNNATVDTTAPTPNPSSFSISPTPTGTSTITMTATSSTDAKTPPVQYFFNETSGNAGGSDSGWQTSSTFTDTGLAAGTQYTYRVQVRDSAPTPNVTTFSNSASATTRSVAGAHPASPFNVARANIVNP